MTAPRDLDTGAVGTGERANAVRALQFGAVEAPGEAVGLLMPNIPRMGVFWSAMESALATATSGRAEPRAALENARQRMLRKP